MQARTWFQKIKVSTVFVFIFRRFVVNMNMQIRIAPFSLQRKAGHSCMNSSNISRAELRSPPPHISPPSHSSFHHEPSSPFPIVPDMQSLVDTATSGLPAALVTLKWYAPQVDAPRNECTTSAADRWALRFRSFCGSSARR
jgi:hypothetical protein